MLFSKAFFPKNHTDSVFSNNYQLLYQKGIRLILFDIDNTLVSYDVAEPTQAIVELMAKLHQMGIKVILFSNNNFERVNVFAAKLPHVEAIADAMKPFPTKYNKVMAEHGFKKNQVAMIGDQIFTDVLGGNLAGVYTILVKPVTTKDEWITKIKRGVEKRVINQYLKYTDKHKEK